MDRSTLNVDQGSDWSKSWPIYDPTGALVNPSGWTVKAQIRDQPGAALLHEWTTGGASPNATFTAGVVGTATATTATSLTDSTAGWATSAWVGNVVSIGAVYAEIISNTATVLTLVAWTDGNGNFTSTPAAGSYLIAPKVTLSVPAATSTAWTWTSGRYDIELTDASAHVFRVAAGSVLVDQEITV